MMAHLFRIDGLTDPSEASLRRAIARRDARLSLEIDVGRGLVAVEGADGPTIEKALQAACAETGVTYRGPIAPHHDAP
jgi:hypothetical protein